MCDLQCVCLQALKSRVRFPYGFNRPYTDVTVRAKAYLLDELANLIWIGGVVAFYGPPGFQELWTHLRAALKHHLYGVDATEDDMCAAAASLRKYACLLEQMVLRGEVCPKAHVDTKAPSLSMGHGACASVQTSRLGRGIGLYPSSSLAVAMQHRAYWYMCITRDGAA